jgi:hypothetical protein
MSEKYFLYETKNHNPPTPKLNGRPLHLINDIINIS